MRWEESWRKRGGERESGEKRGRKRERERVAGCGPLSYFFWRVDLEDAAGWSELQIVPCLSQVCHFRFWAPTSFCLKEDLESGKWLDSFHITQNPVSLREAMDQHDPVYKHPQCTFLERKSRGVRSPGAQASSGLSLLIHCALESSPAPRAGVLAGQAALKFLSVLDGCIVTKIVLNSVDQACNFLPKAQQITIV